MKLRHLPRPSASFLVASAALVVALSGSASSLPGTGTVQHDDLGPHVVHRNNIHDNAVNGAKVDESTLGKVPNAAKVNGMTLRKFSYSAGDTAPEVTLVAFSGFEISASCTAGELALELHGADAPVAPELNGYVVDLTTKEISTMEASFQSGTEDLLAGSSGTSLVGQVQVMNTSFLAGSPVMSINYNADEFTTFDECHASGTIVIG